MRYRSPRMAWLLALGVGCGLSAGCSNEHVARTGTILAGDLRVGDYAPDFSFVGQDGEVRTFGSIRGVVTLVVFPTMPDWPDCQRCSAIAALAGQHTKENTPVVAVSIATPGSGEKALAKLHQCKVKGPSPLIALHDRQGRVRAMFGSKAAGRFYTVDSNGRISAIGSLDDLNAMKAALQSSVDEHEKYWSEINDHSGV